MQSVFFFVALRWAPRPFGGARAKKKHHPGCFFFAPAPGKGRGRRSPVPTRGQSKKKTPPRVFFFCCGPGERQGKEKPRGRRHGARAKKKTPPRVSFFFCSGPGERQGKEPKPRAGARGQSKKKNTTQGGVFFFAAAPRGRSLTHCGPGWRCLPLAGVVFSFCCGPARTGVVFFFLLWPRPDAHSLTVGWGDFGKARVVFFFLLRPRRVFLDNSKKCLGYYIGSKKTRRGHSKKKTPLPTLGSFFGKPSNRCRTILGTQKGTLILTTTHPEMRFRVSARALARRQARLDEAPV